MADSIQRAVSDGTLVSLDVAIQHQPIDTEQDSISVYFDDLAAPEGSWAWNGTGTAVLFTPAVPVGVEVTLVRTTDRSELWHTYSQGAAFTAKTLDESLTQNLRIAQEAMEQGLSGDFYKDINMHGHHITNVAPGENPGDVATVAQLNAAVDTSNVIRTFDTYAQALATARRVGARYRIQRDETRAGRRVIYQDNGTNLVFSQYDDGAGVNNRDHRREILIDLPIEFPDYQAILTANGYTNDTAFMFPGSFAIDEVAREVVVVYGPSWTTPTPYAYLAVFNLDTRAYKGYVRAVYSVQEGVEVVGDGAARKVYIGDRQLGNLYEYAWPVAANYTGQLLASPVVRAVGLYNQFSRCAVTGVWAFEQKEPSVGQQIDRSTLALMDANFTSIGTIPLDVAYSSYVTTSTNAYGTRWPKRQGFALGPNVLVTSHGASHDTGVQGGEQAYNQGCRVLSRDGAVLRDSMTRPDAFKAVIAPTVGGTMPVRIENEGCKFLRDGSVVALYVYRTRNSVERASQGVLIMREFTDTGLDFSTGAAPSYGWDSQRFEVGVFPRSLGGYINPVTGVAFTSINDVCDYLVLTNRKMFSIYTSTYTINDLTGAAIPAGIFVRITNLNGVSFAVEYISISTGQTYVYMAQGGTIGGNNRTVGRAQHRASGMLFDGGVLGSGQKLARLHVPSFDGTGQTFLMLDLQSNNGSANVMLGGGSGSFRAVTSIQQWTTDVHGNSTGEVRWLTNSAGDYRPGADNRYQIGYSDFRVKQIFLETGPIGTSDEREKTDLRPISDAVLDAWGAVAIGEFQWLRSILEKGEGARKHIGVLAQAILREFTERGLDACEYGLLCYDEWDALDDVWEVQPTPDGEGTHTVQVQFARPAGNRWGIRADQCLMLEAAYQRRRADRLEAMVNERLAALEAKLT